MLSPNKKLDYSWVIAQFWLKLVYVQSPFNNESVSYMENLFDRLH